MKFFGKQIPTDKINFVMNCISFVLGIIFFVRMQVKMNEVPTPVTFNAEHDSLIKIETKIALQLKELKVVQDSIALSINRDKTILNQNEIRVNEKRKEVVATIRSDWDHLKLNDQNRYIDQLLSNIKQGKK